MATFVFCIGPATPDVSIGLCYHGALPSSRYTSKLVGFIKLKSLHFPNLISLFYL
jgi:hypothetical protein